MGNKINEAINNLIDVVEANPSELLEITYSPLILQLKQLAVGQQRYSVAATLRDEEMRRDNLKQQSAGKG